MREDLSRCDGVPCQDLNDCWPATRSGPLPDRGGDRAGWVRCRLPGHGRAAGAHGSRKGDDRHRRTGRGRSGSDSRRFNQEARVAASLQHPNVATVYDFGSDPETGLDFLVMELLRGEDLAKRLVRAGPPPLKVALRILRDAARGVAAGHRVDSSTGTCPATSFSQCGIARTASGCACWTSASLSFAARGRRRYAAHPWSRSAFSRVCFPEQLQGERELTPASDVFSLGVVAYHVLTGERPFAQGETEPCGIPPGIAAAPHWQSRGPSSSGGGRSAGDGVHSGRPLSGRAGDGGRAG